MTTTTRTDNEVSWEAALLAHGIEPDGRPLSKTEARNRVMAAVASSKQIIDYARGEVKVSKGCLNHAISLMAGDYVRGCPGCCGQGEEFRCNNYTEITLTLQ